MSAVDFPGANAFATPLWAADPAILRRLEPSDEFNRMRNIQINVLNNLLGSVRFLRLVEMETLDGPTVWAPTDFLSTVRKGVWHELDRPHPRIDAYARNLQRAWLDIAAVRIYGSVPGWTGPHVPSGDEKPFYRTQVKALRASSVNALPRTTDPQTRFAP